MIETRKAPGSMMSRPGRWLLKLLAALQPKRSIGRKVAAGLGLIALLVLFGAIGYGIPALVSVYQAR